MTEDEHKARAMLLGMEYHHGNGMPIYFIRDDMGIPDVTSFVHADTMEPFFDKGTGATQEALAYAMGYVPSKRGYHR